MGGLLGMGSSSRSELPSVVKRGLASNAGWFSRGPNTVPFKMDYVSHGVSIRCCTKFTNGISCLVN